jgi:hypothetical protein
MTTTIDAPGLVKFSLSDSSVRDLTSERKRMQRRLKIAKQKLEGIQVLKDDLQPYLQPGDYEFLRERLEREVKRWAEEEIELTERLRLARREVRRKEARWAGMVYAWALRDDGVVS